MAFKTFVILLLLAASACDPPVDRTEAARDVASAICHRWQVCIGGEFSVEETGSCVASLTDDLCRNGCSGQVDRDVLDRCLEDTSSMSCQSSEPVPTCKAVLP